MAEKILSLYINTANFQNEYNWYKIEEDGTVITSNDDPYIFNLLHSKDLTHDQSLILYVTEKSANVFWGRDNIIKLGNGPKGDWMRRGTSYSGLIEFSLLSDAIEFYAGLLRHWWGKLTDEESSLPELASRVGSIAEKSKLTSNEEVYSIINILLENWRSEHTENITNLRILSEEPLFALESPIRLKELEYYLRYELLQSRVLNSLTNPLIVVAHTVVLENLRGVWRALTDVNNKLELTPTDWVANQLPKKDKESQTKNKSICEEIKYILGFIGYKIKIKISQL